MHIFQLDRNGLLSQNLPGLLHLYTWPSAGDCLKHCHHGEDYVSSLVLKLLQATCSRRQQQPELCRRWPTAQTGWTSPQALQLKAECSPWCTWLLKVPCPCAVLLPGPCVT